MKPLSLSLAALTLLGVVLAARDVHADACISAYEQAQTLRRDGKLGAAKAQAAACAREACPALLVKDCTRWLGEIDASMPSVVFDVRAPSGADISDVRIDMDGSSLALHNEGAAFSVDPGAHVFRFEVDGAPPVEQKLVVREGEKNRRVSVTMPMPDKRTKPARPIPTGVWIFGGASVVAFTMTAVFAIDGLSKKSTLDECRPRCAPDDVDAMSARFTLADVALGAGVMAGLAALYLFVTRPTVTPAANKDEVRLGVRF